MGYTAAMPSQPTSAFDFFATITWGIVAMVLTLPYVAEHAGLLAAIAAGVMFPLTGAILPAIMLFAHGYIWPAVVCYGGAALVVWLRDREGRGPNSDASR